jgi:hypothetical protein
MSNTIKTLSDGDLVRKYLAGYLNKLKFLKTINHEYDNRFEKSGAKNGGTLVIKNRNEFEVRTGSIMDTKDVTETTQTLTVATVKGIDTSFSGYELEMSVDDFDEMVINPQMDKLAAITEYTVLAGVVNDVYTMTGASGMATEPNTLAAALNANAKLSQNLAPESDRYMLMDSIGMAATVAAMGVYFHPASELESAISSGYIGQAAGMKWMESNMLPRHTNGTRTDTTPVTTIGGTVTVPTGGIVNGDATITMTAFASNTTYKAGDVFTIADVYAVNYETKQAYSFLQQFVVTADITASTNDMACEVSPTPQATGAKQNISIASTGAKAILNLTGGGSGAASAILTQNLAYQKDAFTFVSADMHIEPGQRMARAVIDGISMRIWRGSDIINDKFPCRIDVLFGWKTIHAPWAVRVRG